MAQQLGGWPGLRRQYKVGMGVAGTQACENALYWLPGLEADTQGWSWGAGCWAWLPLMWTEAPPVTEACLSRWSEQRPPSGGWAALSSGKVESGCCWALPAGRWGRRWDQLWPQASPGACPWKLSVNQAQVSFTAAGGQVRARAVLTSQKGRWGLQESCLCGGHGGTFPPTGTGKAEALAGGSGGPWERP